MYILYREYYTEAALVSWLAFLPPMLVARVPLGPENIAVCDSSVGSMVAFNPYSAQFLKIN